VELIGHDKKRAGSRVSFVFACAQPGPPLKLRPRAAALASVTGLEYHSVD
jgi:hypothetical protein